MSSNHIGSINGGVFAIGDNNVVRGSTTFYAGVDVDGLRHALTALAHQLAALPPSPAVINVWTQARHLDTAVATKAARQRSGPFGTG